MQVTDAKLVGALSSYSHNGVHISNRTSEIGDHDLPSGSSPKPYIDVNLAGGVGTYLVVATINGVIREMARCGPNVTELRLTTWASENGWILAEKRLTYIF